MFLAIVLMDLDVTLRPPRNPILQVKKRRRRDRGTTTYYLIFIQPIYHTHQHHTSLFSTTLAFVQNLSTHIASTSTSTSSHSFSFLNSMYLLCMKLKYRTFSSRLKITQSTNPDRQPEDPRICGFLRRIYPHPLSLWSQHHRNSRRTCGILNIYQI